MIWKTKYWNNKLLRLDEETILKKYPQNMNVGKPNLLVMNYYDTDYYSKNAIREGESKVFRFNKVKYKVSCIKAFQGAIVRDEDYLLYTMSKMD